MEFADILASKGFMPHGHCYLWAPEILWLHVISDAIIVFAYYCIPFLLAYIVYKAKIHHRFNFIFLLFSIFILACGTTHLMEIINVWKVEYFVSGLIKALTALISLITAIALIPALPDIIKLLQHPDDYFNN